MKKSEKETKVNVLGTIYIVEIKKNEEMKKLADDKDNSFYYGLCKYSDKAIYINEEVAKNESEYRETLRHELLHAFAKESGMFTQVPFALDEMCVDWYALQFPKIYKAFEELNIL